MSRSIRFTQAFSGRPIALEIDSIKDITGLVTGPDAWGVVRKEGDPYRDFPVCWIERAIPRGKRNPSGRECLVALQSDTEIRAAMQSQGADLHVLNIARARLRTFLQDASMQGVKTFRIYASFGSSDARETWRQGSLKEMTVPALIANLEASRPLGFVTPGAAIDLPLPGYQRPLHEPK